MEMTLRSTPMKRGGETLERVGFAITVFGILKSMREFKGEG